MSTGWVVFDLIGVLAEPSWRDIAAKSELEWSALKLGEHPEDSFWSAAEQDVYRKLLNFRRDRLELVHNLKRSGVKVCVATNFAAGWLDTLLAKIEQPNLFDAKVISAEVHAAKPAKAFWDAVLKCVPRGSIFVDDRKENCDAAREAGFLSIWAHPACNLDEEVERLLHLPSGETPAS